MSCLTEGTKFFQPPRPLTIPEFDQWASYGRAAGEF
jgi:hypothetical protein